jgi:hypothetical protein
MNTQTSNYIYKDYRLIDGILLKQNVDDSKHLIWKFGGVPCIDSVFVWDKWSAQIRAIQISTKKGRMFRVTAEVFDNNKQEINFGFGKQYFIDKNFWTIVDPVKKQREQKAKIIEEEIKKQTTLF